MRALRKYVFFCVLLFIYKGKADRSWFSVDDLENHISHEDLQLLLHSDASRTRSSTTPRIDLDYAAAEDATTEHGVPKNVDCFGLGSMTRQLPWLFNMKPDTANDVNTHFYFSSRKKSTKDQVYPGAQFGLEWVDFKENRLTIMIFHGFMSHSNASWVNDMTKAFLQWGDVNVFAVDWSKGGNTWKYWRAVANTRRVGDDVTRFIRQLINATGVRVKDFYFVGHSLGAHIASYVSYHLGGVSRITGLDPAQPCFLTTSHVERLDKNDADFVDIIHTNGRLLKKIGFGLPHPTGHADFYPNGGMKQPGCKNKTNSIWQQLKPAAFERLNQAICSHGRAYMLFTESLISNNCTFLAHRWNLTYEGVNNSLMASCDKYAFCAEMGINAIGRDGRRRANGHYFILTTEKEPYCDAGLRQPAPGLLRDLKQGFSLEMKAFTMVTLPYADPDRTDAPEVLEREARYSPVTEKSWFSWFKI